MAPVNVLIYYTAGTAIGAKVAVHDAALLTLRVVALVAEECITKAKDTEVVVGVQ